MGVIKATVKKGRGHDTARDLRWERFAQALVKGMTLGQAMEYSGAAHNHANASRLSKKPEIVKRVRELRAQMAFRLRITVDTLVMDLQSHRDQAIALDKPGDAIQATMAIAKLLGLIVDKAELEILMKPAREPTDVKELTLAEWEERFVPKQLAPPKPPNGHA